MGMENNIGRIIDITSNNGYETYKDDFVNREESIHYDLYKKGIEVIKKIINNSERIDEKSKDINMSNIILFSGERGSGKSSSMNSFAEFLKESEFIGKEYNLLISGIETIDPTLLNANDSLVETVVAKLFDHYLKKVEDSSSSFDVCAQRKILEQFKKVYNCIKTIHEDKRDRFKNELYTENTIETIQRLGGSFNLKNELFVLINEYLRQMSDKQVGNGGGNRFLLIKIDDLDMNISHAYSMLEEIRRYLNLPNVIILLAAYESQLIDVLKDNFYQQFIEKREISETREKIQIMAEKYLIKLLPLEYRLYLFNLEEGFDDIRVKYKAGEEGIVNAKELILEKIYTKTRLIFLKDKFGKNELVPTNLREYIHFIKFLLSLEDVQSCGINDINTSKKRKIILKNLLEFKDYFLNSHTKNKLDFKGYQLIEEIFYSDSDKVNLAVHNFLAEKYLTPETSQSGMKLDRDKYKNLGPIIDIIEDLKDRYLLPRDRFLLSTIYASYSIRILELILRNDKPILDDLKSTKVEDYNLPLYDIFGEDIFGNEKFIPVSKEGHSRVEFEIKSFYDEVFTSLEGEENGIKFKDIFQKAKENQAYETLLFTYFIKFGKERISRLSTTHFGNTEYIIFNITNPFFYTLYKDFALLRTDYMKTEPNENALSLNTELMYPMYSLDFLVKFRMFVSAVVKDTANGYFTYIKAFFKSIDNVIEYIIDKNGHLKDSGILENYRNDEFIETILNYEDNTPLKVTKRNDNESVAEREKREKDIEQEEKESKEIGLKNLINRVWEVYIREKSKVPSKVLSKVLSKVPRKVLKKISKKDSNQDGSKLQKVNGFSQTMMRAEDFIVLAFECIEILQSNHKILPTAGFSKYIDKYDALINEIIIEIEEEFINEESFEAWKKTVNNLRTAINKIVNRSLREDSHGEY